MEALKNPQISTSSPSFIHSQPSHPPTPSPVSAPTNAFTPPPSTPTPGTAACTHHNPPHHHISTPCTPFPHLPTAPSSPPHTHIPPILHTSSPSLLRTPIPHPQYQSSSRTAPLRPDKGCDSDKLDLRPSARRSRPSYLIGKQRSVRMW